MCADFTNKEVTQILLDLRHGEEKAAERLLAVVYDELKKLAQAKMRSERADHTLQPTALVHEAFMRLMGGGGDWENRAHFFGASAEAMRRILVDHARGRGAQKRGAGRNRVSFDVLQLADEGPEELIAVDDALSRLEEFDPQKAEVVKLRFFAGLTIEETAAVLGVSVRTVNRSWNFAKAWLYREIHES
jgi:RNA polymerase sigma factor (TIGR02999 family)